MEFREGPNGALLDEYERALRIFIKKFRDIDQGLFIKKINPNPEDRFDSLKIIANHVINAGYSYANYIREQYGGFDVTEHTDDRLENVSELENEMEKMFDYHDVTMSDKYEFRKEFFTDPIKVRWGQVYDLEQICEHAIVHLMRHRRQADKFLRKV